MLGCAGNAVSRRLHVHVLPFFSSSFPSPFPFLSLYLLACALSRRNGNQASPDPKNLQSNSSTQPLDPPPKVEIIKSVVKKKNLTKGVFGGNQKLGSKVCMYKHNTRDMMINTTSRSLVHVYVSESSRHRCTVSTPNNSNDGIEHKSRESKLKGTELD